MEHVTLWNNNVDETMDPYMATYTQDFGTFDNASQYDYTSSYAQSSAAASEAEYPHNRNSKSQYYATQPQKVSRTDSTRSVIQPHVHYPDSAYYSATMSPSMDMEFFTSYPQTGQDFTQEYLVYDQVSQISVVRAMTGSDHQNSAEPAMPESPNATSDGETTGSSNESSIPPRSHHLYNAGPADDGLYHCPFAATEDCGHEPKMLKCEYEYVSPYMSCSSR